MTIRSQSADMTGLVPFALRLPPNTRFGRGAALRAVTEVAALGPRLIFVHGGDPVRSADLRGALDAAGATLQTVACSTEPTLDMLTDALDAARDWRADAVVAMGGGAALDLGKALAALLPAPSTDPLEHLEVVGAGRPLAAAPLPFVAVPTTAGTGSEATKNAVITVPEHARKVSLRDDRMVADLVVIDPSLTDGTPPRQTLASGLDAVTQLIEPYLSARATPFTDALCRPAIVEGLSALATLMDRGEAPQARDALAYGAYVSGIALANAGLGAVHGLAGVVGGETQEPHGAICGRLLPEVLCTLAAVAPEGSQTAERLAQIDADLQGTLGVGCDGLADWIAQRGLGPGAAPLDPESRRRIAAQSAASSSMKASPITLSETQLAGVLERAGW